MLKSQQAGARTRMGRFAAYGVLVSVISAACEKEEPQKDERDLPPTVKPFYDYRSPSKPTASAPARDAAPAFSASPAIPQIRGRPPIPSRLGCQEDMARLGSYCIDRYEIHLVGAAGEAHPYYKRPPYSMSDLIAVSSAGVYPQGYMSQEMADKACRNAGKRLCTREEWQNACRGQAGNRYPYGNSFEQGRCNVNVRSQHILDKYFPDIPHLKRTGKQFNDPQLLQDPDYLAKTGQFESCVTPEGLFDMDGNLSEWVADTVMKESLHGTFTGNAFMGYLNAGCGRWTDAHSSNYQDYSMGTRCCADVK
jgi:hypothetical protein